MPPLFLRYFLICVNYFFYGETLADYFGALVQREEPLQFLARYHRFISFALYLAGERRLRDGPNAVALMTFGPFAPTHSGGGLGFSRNRVCVVGRGDIKVLKKAHGIAPITIPTTNEEPLCVNKAQPKMRIRVLFGEAEQHRDTNTWNRTVNRTDVVLLVVFGSRLTDGGGGKRPISTGFSRDIYKGLTLYGC